IEVAHTARVDLPGFGPRPAQAPTQIEGRPIDAEDGPDVVGLEGLQEVQDEVPQDLPVRIERDEAIYAHEPGRVEDDLARDGPTGPDERPDRGARGPGEIRLELHRLPKQGRYRCAELGGILEAHLDGDDPVEMTLGVERARCGVCLVGVAQFFWWR